MRFTKRVTGAIAAILILAVFSVLMPVQNVQADYWSGANAPYRGSTWPASMYIYSTSYQTSIYMFYYMKVRVEEWQYYSSNWWRQGYSEKAAYNVNTISDTLKKQHTGLTKYQYQNRSKFWYSYAGEPIYSYDLWSPVVSL